MKSVTIELHIKIFTQIDFVKTIFKIVNKIIVYKWEFFRLQVKTGIEPTYENS